MTKAINRALMRAEDILQHIAAYSRAAQDSKNFRCFGEATAAFAEAKDSLMQTMAAVVAQLPKALPISQDEDIDAMRKMTRMAEEMEKIAERLRCLAPGTLEDQAVDHAVEERRKRDARLALVMMLEVWDLGTDMSAPHPRHPMARIRRIAHKGGVPCAVHALCEKLAVLHHRDFGKFRRLKGRH